MGEEGGSDSDDAEMSSTASAALARIADSIGNDSINVIHTSKRVNCLLGALISSRKRAH